ncbi:MAG: MerR family transcriptional regulator [Candidatus Omnitrophica bacterium]|nr:MerR family transcriptional regulator [Candidatus Omnitrophota bacterium]
MKKISAQDVVKKFNIKYHTLNYYTVIGLLPFSGRSGNQRMYDEGEVRRRMVEISRLSQEGYPLSLIRKKLVGI